MSDWQFIDGWADWLRIVNMILAVVVLIWLVVRRVRKKNLYSNQLRNDVWLIAFYWTSASFVGTIEQLFDTGSSIRVILGSFALMITFRLLWRYDEDWYAIRGSRIHRRRDDRDAQRNG